MVASLVMACVLSSAPTQPCENAPRYYILWFGSDIRGCWRPTKTHCWMTWVKASPNEPLQTQTISWYPADRRVNFFRPFQKEVGCNLGLHETLKLARDHGETIMLIGPYETDCSRWNQAVSQVERLATGTVYYQGADIQIRRDESTAHCLHAITDADPLLYGQRQNAKDFGRDATRKLFWQQVAVGSPFRLI